MPIVVVKNHLMRSILDLATYIQNNLTTRVSIHKEYTSSTGGTDGSHTLHDSGVDIYTNTTSKTQLAFVFTWGHGNSKGSTYTRGARAEQTSNTTTGTIYFSKINNDGTWGATAIFVIGLAPNQQIDFKDCIDYVVGSRSEFGLHVMTLDLD